MMKKLKKTYIILIVTLGLITFSVQNSYGQYEPSSRDTLIQTTYGIKYDGIITNLEGYYTVISKDKSGLIDSLGNEVVPPIYDEISIVSDGMVAVSTGDWGYLNLLNGKTIPEKYLYAGSFIDGYAVVYMEAKDSRKYNRVGVINKKGKTVIPFKYESIGFGNEIFSEGKACVCAYNDARQIKCGFVNQKGKVEIPLVYDKVLTGFQHGISFVKCEDKTGGINHSGDTIIPFIYSGAKQFKHGLAEVSGRIDNERGGHGLIDILGNKIIPCIYQQIGYYDKKIVVVKKGDFWGLIDMNNNSLTDFKYYNELCFVNGKAYVTLVGDKRLYLLEDGTEVLEQP